MIKRAELKTGLGQKLLEIFGFVRNFDAIALEVSENLRFLRSLQPITGREPACFMVYVEGSGNSLFSLGASQSQQRYIKRYVTEADLWVENTAPAKAKWVLQVLSDSFITNEPVIVRVTAHADYVQRAFSVNTVELITDLCDDPILLNRLYMATSEA